MLAQLLPDIILDPSYCCVYADWLDDEGADGTPWRGWADRLDALTPAQEALMPAWRDYWLAVGLRADGHLAPDEELRPVLAAVYAEAGLEAPKVIVRLGSPMRGAVGAAMLSQYVRQSVWESVRQYVWESVRQSVEQPVWESGYGLHDADWLAFYSYLFCVGRVHACARMLPLMRLAHLCGWWWPFEGAVVVTPAPSRLDWDGAELAGFEYPDGWGWSK